MGTAEETSEFPLAYQELDQVIRGLDIIYMQP